MRIREAWRPAVAASGRRAKRCSGLRSTRARSRRRSPEGSHEGLADAQEIAAQRLKGMPSSKRGVNELADRENWPTNLFRARKRTGAKAVVAWSTISAFCRCWPR